MANRRNLYKMVKENNYKLTKTEAEALSWDSYFWMNSHSINGIAKYTVDQYKRAYRKMIVDILELRNN